MAWRDSGNLATFSIEGTSTGSWGLETNPSTSTLIAELSASRLTWMPPNGAITLVTWVIGASTNALWQVEQASDTSFTSMKKVTYIHTPANQSGQYQFTYDLAQGDRLRARLQTGLTGVATAQITVEPMT